TRLCQRSRGAGRAARRLPVLHRRRQDTQSARRPGPDRETGMNGLSVEAEAARLLARLGVAAGEGDLPSFSPIDGTPIGKARSADAKAVEATVGRAHDAFLAWRRVPPPRRGELVRRFGEVLRDEKDALGRLVSLE